MTEGSGIIEQRPHPGGAQQPWFGRERSALVAALGGETERGLTRGEAADRLSRYEPSQITGQRPPSVWAVALHQLRNPMNIVLVVVVAVSVLIGELSTGLIVALLIVPNIVLGTRQELNARATVDALAKPQVPEAMVVRDGELLVVPAEKLVPGDIVHVEAAGLVPADGRILRCATLETQEAALTGKSAPVAKDAQSLPAGAVAIGDRTNIPFPNTSVIGGTTTMAVTDTGMSTRMGQIATMLGSVKRTRSPLQRERDSPTRSSASSRGPPPRSSW
jgi:Ca2+-transporting ATPase